MDLETIYQKLEVIQALNKEVLTIDEASIYIGCTKGHLYKLTSKNKIPYYKPNNKLIYFDKSELNDWLRQNPQKTIQQIEAEANDFVTQKIA